jgi:protein SCO1/2
VAACGGGSPSYSGIVRDPPPAVGGDALPDATRGGEPIALRADPGGLLVVYFGYTSCPDVCPTTMADLRVALEELPERDAERVRVAMITVDPARDTGETLTRYLRTFFPEGHALRTSDEDLLRRVAERFGATFDVSSGPDGRIEVSHTAFLYAVDGGGRLLLQWPFRTAPDLLRDDLSALLQVVAETT